MKELFWEYLNPTDEEKDRLWNDAVFVFDTNVLLNLYRYSDKTRNELLSAFSSMNGRVWIPYHVGLEFMKNRCDVIFETVNKYENINKNANNFLNNSKNELRLKDEDVADLKKNIEKWVTKQKNKNLRVTDPNNDRLLDKILELFDNKIGDPYDEKLLASLKKKGAERFENNTPPGYKDKCKGELSKEDLLNDNNMYGDFIIWNELISYSKKTHKDIIFVTHDQKEDWWTIVKGKTLGPRHELRKEFTLETKQKFYMYSMNQFIELFLMHKNSVDKSVIDEIESVDKVDYQNRSVGSTMELLQSYDYLDSEIMNVLYDTLDDEYYNKDDELELIIEAVDDCRRKDPSKSRSRALEFKLEELINAKNRLDVYRRKYIQLKNEINRKALHNTAVTSVFDRTVIKMKECELYYQKIKDELNNLL